MSASKLDIALLKTIHAAGGRATSTAGIDRMPNDRLVELGWLTRQPIGHAVLGYQMTPEGSAIALGYL